MSRSPLRVSARRRKAPSGRKCKIEWGCPDFFRAALFFFSIWHWQISLPGPAFGDLLFGLRPDLFYLALADFVTLSSLRRPSLLYRQKEGRRRLDKVTKSTRVSTKRKENCRRLDTVKITCQGHNRTNLFRQCNLNGILN